MVRGGLERIYEAIGSLVSSDSAGLIGSAKALRSTAEAQSLTLTSSCAVLILIGRFKAGSISIVYLMDV